MMPSMQPVRVSVPTDRFWLARHAWHQQVMAEFDHWQDGSSLKRFYLLKCHRRSRKTTFGLNILVREAVQNAKRVYGYIGPTYRQAKGIVWRDPNMLDAALPDQKLLPWQRNETELYVRFPNRSLLVVLGADDPDSLRGYDFAGVFVDEWAMCKPDIWSLILQPILSQDPSRWAMFAYTPAGQNHASQMWDGAARWEDWYRLLLRSSESGLIPADELAKARRTMPAWQYDQEYECADIADEEATLITSRLLESLKTLRIQRPYHRHIVAVDPDASVDGDECVMYYLEEGEVLDEDVCHERDSLKIGIRAELFGRKHDCTRFAVDSIGVGNGVCGKLCELGKQVHEFNAATSASDDAQFANLRAEAYWRLMEHMQNCEVMYPGARLPASSGLLLRQDLSAVKVKPGTTGARILLEPKRVTKQRLGRSPDRGDCYVIGHWGLQFAPEEHPSERLESWRQDTRGIENEDLAMSYATESVL